MPAVLSVEKLYKSFGSKSVITDLSFDVEKGSIFAFLGANGSGKTTTIRCLLNILKPTSGTTSVFGSQFSLDMAPKIGYLPEERGLYATTRVAETLVYFGELKGIERRKATTWAYEYLERVGLSDHAQTEIKKLSSGQQQKIQLGITLINQPELLILDEPTKGLDPVNRALFMNMFADFNAQGATIVFVSHQMDEVEQIADSLVMIKNGKRALYGPLQNVKQQFGTNTIHLSFSGEIPVNDALYEQTHTEKNETQLTPKPNITPKEILHFLTEQQLTISDYSLGAPSLQDIFVRVMDDPTY
ncbi:ABC transporter ATP-binding protein [candidate division WWE3 bacterium CG_4_9_14_3_um_filter_41_6]|uniref:ABC transporter ATP-binding protein n=1 Tax=candidate division WWE3 bacterium CG_4_10_14_0_2_um_filter_41_14 TaxID=1975072 RepID=A0A2M7TID4_UNCKA|nr:MAG: ABC transporter ATP-binding protein [candidate division WWE3 bacterium CG_4_10_14_0_2_um_filter_41_14]PJA38195.1 MAG: ABC transporter ATP-binding protein [candidate division WWE3 bacterium CG_4_9_14_3_um_filter_41_6]